MSLSRATRWMLAPLLCVLAWVAWAQQVAVPPLRERVTDLTATLSVPQRAALEERLRSFEAAKGSQIAVLLVPTTGEESIEQYALRVAEQWRLGRKGIDDGALLVLATRDRSLRIEVGYGLEGALNDATCKRIISDFIVPHLQRGEFHAGIEAGVERMIRVIDGEALPPPSTRVRPSLSARFEQVAPLLFMLVVVLGSLLQRVLGRLPAALVVAVLAAVMAGVLVGAWVVALLSGLAAFVFTLFGGRLGRGGRWQGRSGGGGFPGGGFSGGGGGFGGGGASGRW